MCGKNRAAGKLGVCGKSAELALGRASLHMWEEPCISGKNGSGAVFFSGCAMKCVFCQNKEISRKNAGENISAGRLYEIFWELKEKGAHNINLITAEHFTPHILYAVSKAKCDGFDLPFILNCGGYCKKETLKMFEGLIDIYMPDFKYITPALAKKYSNAYDYPEYAKQTIEECVRQKPRAEIKNGLMKQGVIVRHLCLPGNILEAKKVVGYLFEKYGESIFLSIMSQFTPIEIPENYPELNRRLKISEYERVIEFCVKKGIKNVYIQEGSSASESFIPKFDGEGVIN